MVIRHGEAFGLSKYLTVENDDTTNKKVIYRPTVHYAYLPSDSTINSLLEFRMRNYELQGKVRILTDEIIEGADEVGVLLLGGRFVSSWWCGSVLNIEQARKLVPNQNATTVQVAISLVAALNFVLKNKFSSICLPEDLDSDEILDLSLPFLGDWISSPVDWPRENDPIRDGWQFTSFQSSN